MCDEMTYHSEDDDYWSQVVDPEYCQRPRETRSPHHDDPPEVDEEQCLLDALAEHAEWLAYCDMAAEHEREMEAERQREMDGGGRSR